MDDIEFPRLVFKRSEGPNAQPIWSLGVFDVREVADQEAFDAAVADGWLKSPDEEPEPAPAPAPTPAPTPASATVAAAAAAPVKPAADATPRKPAE